jgi:rSAM/selenodomain-associated transferase 1
VPERLLFVFAKEPRPGQVKTRMCPPLRLEQAARCQQAFLSDLLDRLDGLAGSRTVLWAAPRGDAPELARIASERGIELAWQVGGDLGARMAHALGQATARGATAVVVGADCPDLPRAFVEEAFCGLAAADFVLGPSSDGGYYLAGCRGAVPPVFDPGVGWGGASVFARTVERARGAGIAPRVLAPWRDVDDFGDLRALAARLRTRAGNRGPDELPACRRLVAELAAEGVVL